MLCIPLKTTSQEKLLSLIRRATKKSPDLLEIWLDDLKNPDIRKIIKSSPCPTIFVNRKNPTYKQFQEIMNEKSAIIDLDIKTSKKIIKKLLTPNSYLLTPISIILSYHNHTKTPSQKVLEKIVTNLFSLGASMAKIATHIQKEEDEKVLLRVLKKYEIPGRDKSKMIIHGMGEKAKKSRIEAYKSGSAIAYVALNKSSKTAPGQLTIDEWRRAN